MSLNKILVPVREDDHSENSLWHAAAIAKANQSHIEILHCRARPTDMIPSGVVVPLALREQIKKHATSEADHSQEQLIAEASAMLDQLGLTLSADTSLGPLNATWHEEEGKMADLIGPWGRLCDLVVLPRPERERNIGLRSLMSALYECGKPVLMCPPKESRKNSVGERIAVAWNGSLEVTRAIAMAEDLLGSANDVIILDGGATQPVNSADALVSFLHLKGIEARIERIDVGSNPGDTILSATMAQNCDMLIMGAYSHSRKRELVFGGATQHIVDHAELPVVLTH